jgi:hypothetical protein
MSYILDALKKSQAEQAGESTRVQLQYAKRGIRLSQWLAMGLGLLLLVNVVVMLWFFVFRTESPEQGAQVVLNDPPLQARPNQGQSQTGQSQTGQSQPAQRQTGQNQPAQPTMQPPAQPSTQQNSNPQSMPRRVATPAPLPASPSAAPRSTATEKLPRLQLEELQEVEQTLYKDFRFSSHMYSPDDPTAGAIFIDGQMLKIGAAFKGLTIVEINEFSVVFKEVRRGKAREVEIQLADHWN